MKIWALILLAFAALSCQNEDSETPVPTPVVSVKGFSLSPRSYETGNFVQFLELVEEGGEFLTWAGDWIQLGDTQSAAAVTALLDDQYEFKTLIATGWFRTDNGAPTRELNEDNRTLFLEYTTDFARRHQPPMMVLGIELNTAYDYSAENFALFAAEFPMLRDSIRGVSPNTKVGVDFLWEKMLGYRGGLFGGANDTTNTQFELLSEFPSADFIGFNSYPSLIFAHPDSIPANYYSRIADITDKPVAFFETGWHTGADIPNWESSEAEQVRFVERYLELIAPLEPITIIWPFLFDQQTQSPFNTMGLWDRTTGFEKAAWAVWRDAEM